MAQKSGFWKNNGLSLAMFGLFAISIVGHAWAGHRHYNNEQAEHGQPAITAGEYLQSGQFIETVFENWESEFLQMGVFVLLSAFLYQKGSSESKKLGDGEEINQDARRHKQKNSPWPVHRGGLILKLYEHSLSTALFLLFAMSFVLHAFGGAKNYNEEQLEHGVSETVSTLQYMSTSQFWFESFQNWQSEFLSVAALVIFSIYLRERGSSQSKPVAATHSQTGE